MTKISRRKALSMVSATAGFTLAAPSLLRAQSAEPLLIGGLLPLSGNGAIEGLQVLKGIEFAVKEANDAGGALGRPLQLVMENDESNSTRGVTGMRRLIERERVPFVIGTYPTAVAIACAEVAKEYKVPMLSGGSTGVAATDANTPGDPWFFRAWPSSVGQGTDTANAIVERFGAQRVAVVHDSSSYGNSLADQVIPIVEASGAEVVARESFNIGEQDFSSMLIRLRSLRPDAMYIGGWAGDGAMIVRQAREVGLDCQIIGSGSMVSDDFIELAGPASEGFAVATLYEASTPNEVGAAFGERFEAAYGHEAGTLNSLGYDSTSIAIEALRRVGAPDSAAVQQMLLNGMGDFPIVQGPAGATADFDEQGSVNFPMFIAIVKDGKRALS